LKIKDLNGEPAGARNQHSTQSYWNQRLAELADVPKHAEIAQVGTKLEQTPGQVLRDQWYETRPHSPLDWEAIAAAVIAHHQRVQWHPIAPSEDPLIVNDGNPAWILDNGKIEIAWLGWVQSITATAWTPVVVPPPPTQEADNATT
jgi:hypothetical protein